MFRDQASWCFATESNAKPTSLQLPKLILKTPKPARLRFDRGACIPLKNIWKFFKEVDFESRNFEISSNYIVGVKANPKLPLDSSA